MYVCLRLAITTEKYKIEQCLGRRERRRRGRRRGCEPTCVYEIIFLAVLLHFLPLSCFPLTVKERTVMADTKGTPEVKVKIVCQSC